MNPSPLSPAGTWREFAHALTPQQIAYFDRWALGPLPGERHLLEGLGYDDIDAAHQRRVRTRAWAAAMMGPGGLN